MKVLISVIIPSYNSEGTIERCLSSLINQSSDVKFEVIVVDSSTDATPRIIRQSFPDVTLVSLKEQTFPGHARNIGIERAKGNILAFIDADCIVSAHWLSNIIKAHESQFSIICGAIQNGYPENLVSWADFFYAASEFLVDSPRRFVNSASTSNLSCKREPFEKGCFFPDTRRAQDAIFSQNVLDKGYQILFEPSICVHHLYRTRLRELVRRETAWGSVWGQISKQYKMKGSMIYKSRFLCLTFPVIKLSLIFSRILRCGNRRLFLLFWRAFPFLLLTAFGTTFGLITTNWFHRNLADQ